MQGEGEINSAAGDQHLADHASDLVDREVDQSLGDNADNVVAEIDEALARIEAGTYGTCAVCGAVIPEERLAAVPTRSSAWTTSAGRSKGERARPHRSAAADRRPGRLGDERAAADLERRAAARRRCRAMGLPGRDRGHCDRRRPADEVDRLGAASDSATPSLRSARSASTTCRTPASRSASSPTRPRR